MLGRCFPVSGIPQGVRWFLRSSSQENACPSLCSHHAQGEAACNITDNMWGIGTPMAFEAASCSFQPSGAHFSASPPVLNHDVFSYAGKKCHVTDGNSFGLLRGSTANMQIPEPRTVDLPTPVS